MPNEVAGKDASPVDSTLAAWNEIWEKSGLTQAHAHTATLLVLAMYDRIGQLEARVRELELAAEKRDDWEREQAEHL